MMVQCVTSFGPIQTVCYSLIMIDCAASSQYVFLVHRYNWMGPISAGRWLSLRR
jgi:hypothetical protein